MDEKLPIDLNATALGEEQDDELQKVNPSPDLTMFLEVIARALAQKWLDQS